MSLVVAEMDRKLGIDNASTTYKAHNFATGE